MAKKSDIPGIGALNSMMDSVEFVKKAWSSFNLPTNLAPTMDVDELDKRIADLRAVEQWLNVNLSMLRGTIQGLEIQRGTLAAVQAFGRAVTGSSDAMAQLAQAARVPPAAPVSSPASPAGPFARPSATADDQNDEEPDVEDESEDGRDDERRMGGRGRADGGRGDAGPHPAAAAAPSGTEVMRKAASSLAAGLSEMQGAVPLQLPSGTQMVNPAAWWNLLQGQFNQVAQAALSGAGVLAGAAAGAAGAKARTDEHADTARTANTARTAGRKGGPVTHLDGGKGAGAGGRTGGDKTARATGTASGSTSIRKNASTAATNETMKRTRNPARPAAGRNDTASRKSRGPTRKTPES